MFFPLVEDKKQFFQAQSGPPQRWIVNFLQQINFRVIGFIEVRLSLVQQPTILNDNLSMKYVQITYMRRVRLKREKLEMFNILKQILNKELETQMPMTSKQDIKSMSTSVASKMTGT